MAAALHGELGWLTKDRKLPSVEAAVMLYDLRTLPYWVGPSPVFDVPADLLVMQGAHRYGPRHPFLSSLERGPEALAQFYADFAPRTVAQMYRLDSTGRPGEDLPPWELPWLLRDRRAPPGEHGLGPEHGVSYYGPCSPQKVALEHERLIALVASIRSDGYKPDAHGHIVGHFMKRGSEHRFFVRGGKHRAAALVFLGHEHVPVRMRDTWPRLVSRAHSDDWPLVSNGQMARELAEAIFDRYFE